ncbi:hypothetical protein [Sediminibacterium ginsengisoli]|uniref:Uncharacterized protein n=1 Tax=Sediminibacterium ginsengisoli TaxID=413434 RepID=A0A1T4L572_9BACT|nr:hypothetical protein [Sediminibacterium ginsengisoli]SJZ49753.1 hypothetical protein SAMN04488132_102305 [Sediminibacterium ginsengisoli]
MYRFLYAMACSAIVMACGKTATSPVTPPSPPAGNTIYQNLNDSSLFYNQSIVIDLNKDGIADFRFSNVLIQENNAFYLQFKVKPLNSNKLLTVTVDEPFVACMNANETIGITPLTPYEWTVSASALVIKNAGSIWEGPWKNRTDSYLPVQLEKNGALYSGWIRISSSNLYPARIIVHDAAVSTVAGTGITAGSK